MMHHRQMMMTSASFLRAPDGVDGGAAATTAATEPTTAAAAPTGEAATAAATTGEGAAATTAASTEGAADPAAAAEPSLLGKPAELTPEQKAAAEADAAAKAVPETYEIKLEGDAKVDPALLEAATPVLKELGLNNEQASKLAGLLAKDIMPKLGAQMLEQANTATAEGIVEQAKTWAAETLADPELGGGKVDALNENLVFAARFRDEFGSPELTKFLSESALGNHPLIIKAFVKAGKALAEGGYHTSDKSAQSKVDDGTLFYGDAFAKKVAAA